MNTAPPPADDLRLLAPAFAGRFAVIIAALVALIARAFLHQPDLAPLIVPLYRRLTRTARRLTALMARLSAGRPFPRPRPGRTGGRAPKPPIPTTRAWLIRTLHHEAAAYGSQLSHLLAEPGILDLLQAAPAARHLLNPLCRMLGIPPTALGTVGRDRCAPSRTESPDTPLGGVAPPATGVFAFKNPESSDAQRSEAAPIAAGARLRPESAAAPSLPPRAEPRPPPCPRLLSRWPWRAITGAKIT